MYRYQSKVHKYIYSLRSSCIAGQTQSLKIIKTSHETDRKYSSEQLVMVANAILRQIFRFQNTDCCNLPSCTPDFVISIQILSYDFIKSYIDYPASCFKYLV